MKHQSQKVQSVRRLGYRSTRVAKALLLGAFTLFSQSRVSTPISSRNALTLHELNQIESNWPDVRRLFSPNQRLKLQHGYTGKLEVQDVVSGITIASVPDVRIMWIDDGSLLVQDLEAETLKIFDIYSGATRQALPGVRVQKCYAEVLASKVVLLIFDERVEVYGRPDASKPLVSFRPFVGSMRMTAMALSPNEGLALFASDSGGLKVYTTKDWQRQKSITGDFVQERLAIDDSGRYIAAVPDVSRDFSKPQPLRLLDTASHSEYVTQKHIVAGYLRLEFVTSHAGEALLRVGDDEFSVPDLQFRRRLGTRKDRGFFSGRNDRAFWMVDMGLKQIVFPLSQPPNNALWLNPERKTMEIKPVPNGWFRGARYSGSNNSYRSAVRSGGERIDLRVFNSSYAHVQSIDSGLELAVVRSGVEKITDQILISRDRLAVTNGQRIEIWSWKLGKLERAFDFDGVQILGSSVDGEYLFWVSKGALYKRQLSEEGAQPTKMCEVGFIPHELTPNLAGAVVTAIRDDYWKQCSDKAPRDGTFATSAFVHSFEGEHFSFEGAGEWLRVVDLREKDAKGNSAVTLNIRAEPSGAWFAYTPDGFWDSSDLKRPQPVAWKLAYKNRQGQADYEIIEFRQFRGRYRNGLIRDILTSNKEFRAIVLNLRDSAPDFGPRPKIELAIAKNLGGADIARVTASDQGGGVGMIQLLVNGAVQAKKKASECRPIRPGVQVCDFDLASVSSGRILAGANVVAAFATEKTDQILTTPVTAQWHSARVRLGNTMSAVAETQLGRRKIFALFVGTGQYNNRDLNLPLPERDAEAMSKVVGEAAKKMLETTEQVRVRLLTTSSAAPLSRPSKTNISNAIREARGWLQGEDLFMLYLSGHGLSAQVKDGAVPRSIYYYPTMEASSFEKSTKAFAEVSISSDELADWLKDLPQKQVLIIDTCQAGSAADQALGKWRDAAGDQRQALEDLQNGTGLFAIMASSSDRLAYESSVFGHGLLTYSLLLSLKTRDLGLGGRVDVMKWFEAARAEVPTLAARIQSSQIPEIAGRGRAFPIGIVSTAIKDRIDLKSSGLFLSRPRVLNLSESEWAQVVRQSLREAISTKANGKKSLFEYFDTELTSKDALQCNIELHRGDRGFSATVQLGNATFETPRRRIVESFPTRESLAQEVAKVIVALTEEFRTAFLKGRETSTP